MKPFLRFPVGFFVLFSLSHNAFPQRPEAGSSLTFAAGYREIRLTDSTRLYRPNSGATDFLHFRPVELDIWYPAVVNKPDSIVNYVRLVNLLQERSNRFQSDSVYETLTTELLQYLNINLQISDSAKLRNLKTNSYKNAKPANGRFPLLIYYSAFNGMSYENISLFERLAERGYVVACIASVGRYPGNMTTKPEDLMVQVDDGLFAKLFLQPELNVDSTETGCIGYSWGGLAACVAAMKDQQITALLSLDGSEMHYYRKSGEENTDMNSLRITSYFQSGKIAAAYTYLESDGKQDEEAADSIFNILPQLKTETRYLHFQNATHEDFSIIPSLAKMTKERRTQCSPLYDTIIECTIDFFDQYLKGNSGRFTTTANKLIQLHLADSLLPLPIYRHTNAISIRGRVIDAKTLEPLAYVNIGIPGKNIGTVSGTDGKFKIETDNPDSIEFSMIGYKNRVYWVTANNIRNTNPVITMEQKMQSLSEVTVVANKTSTHKLGNTTTSHFFNIGLPLKFLGSEIGIVVKPGRKPVLLKAFDFTISENHLDSAVFRFNIYSLKKGAPFQNILSDNIILRVGNQAGPVHLDLTGSKIILKEDVLISLEWIDGGKSGNERGVMFLSAALFNSGTWHRTTSLGKWTKANGLGVGFNISVQTIQNSQP